MKILINIVVIVSVVLTFNMVSAAERNYISIVGSSTVYPFAAVVAERFGKTTKFKTPKIEATGSGGGLKLFCNGIGVKHPDITNSSRRIKKSEVEMCAKNGIKEITEMKIGYDGIVIANSKKAKRIKATKPGWMLILHCQILKSKCSDLRQHQEHGTPLQSWPWKAGVKNSTG